MDKQTYEVELKTFEDDLPLQTIEAPVDTTCDVVAPENVAFQYRLAGPFARAWAYALDLVVIAIYLTVSLFAVGYFVNNILVDKTLISDSFGETLFFIFAFFNLMFAFWFWNAFFEAFWGGRTIGKAIMGLRALTVAGRPIGRSQALLRNILRYADLALGPFCVLIMGMNDRMARLGDLAAGTIVTIERKKKKKTSSFLDQPLVRNVESRIPKDCEISSSLHKTLALYVSRREEISYARRIDIIKPLA
ncbi:MAG: RDD family protein, partial [Thermoguttaceae bacterium]|nr:RDD family protein [Thermoguttaceae bacterium]